MMDELVLEQQREGRRLISFTHFLTRAQLWVTRGQIRPPIRRLGSVVERESQQYLVGGGLLEVVRKVRGLRVAIVGKSGRSFGSPGALRENADALGVIPSITDAYLTSKVVICSLLEGAGTKLKLSETTYYRIPIVTTSVGASRHLLSDGLKLRTGSVDLDTLGG
jgi:hypothetical protein